ncbi:(2Fe-2S)-binding protein [Janthinobacterium sp.]|uniref:(2Fe-2S)-binding protein n=1 Tax=Janthinobacterium sp. TaxID=1871054 RepID=UPI00293D92A4|nr:(2Fe-2S)-binding protein [Janthinobacterium sp.]
MLHRKYDIQELGAEQLSLTIDGKSVAAAAGETVLSVLNAVGLRQLARNDNQEMAGSYCGMGVCHCCQVKIDGRYKRRACQTIVQAGMQVETASNRIELEGLR